MRYFKNIIAHKVFIFTIATFMMVSCGQKVPPTAVPEYKVSKIELQEGEMNFEFPTTLQSAQVVDIYPRVEGYLDKIVIKEGAYVQKGDLLFRINQDDFKQNVFAAEAEVFAAKAEEANARLEVEKVTPLVQQNIVSQYELDKAESNLEAAEAKFKQAKASLEQARINLKYTEITAPASGVISQISVREGSLIKLSNTKPLTTMSAADDIIAYFSVSESVFFKDTASKANKFPEAKLKLNESFEYSETGTLELASGIVNATTGTVLVKAIFPNPKNQLTTGLSAVVILPINVPNAILIPQSATYQLLNKTMAMTVNSENKTVSKEITILGTFNNNYIISEGVEPGDIIILEGVNKLKDNQEIKPIYQ